MLTIKRNVIGLAPGIGPFRILIADDRVDNRHLLRELLQPMGFEVWEAENGQEAVDAFTEWKPHVILMDMLMPVMDGYEAIRRIRVTEQGKSVILVGITASVFEEDLIKVKEAGADEILLKPFRAEKLFELLLRVPGVSYIYEQNREEKTTVCEKGFYQPAIMKLSLELIADMRSAVEQGNMVQFRKLAEEVDKVNPRLAKELTILAKNYDYDKLMTLFQYKEDEINE